MSSKTEAAGGTSANASAGAGGGNDNLNNGNGNDHVSDHEHLSPVASTPSVAGSTPTTAGPTIGAGAVAGPSKAAGKKGKGAPPTTDSDMPQSKDRHEPRGRKPNDGLPPSRAREVQRAFRLRRAEHLAALEERINLLEAENSQLRILLSLPEAERDKIGSGPTGRGKSLHEGGVPMSERVRARKEARARERRLRGLPDLDESTHDESEQGGGGGGKGDEANKRSRVASTLSPGASGAGVPFAPHHAGMHGHGNDVGNHGGMGMFGAQDNGNHNNNFSLPNLPFPNLGFNLPMTPENPFDFESAIFKPPQAPNTHAQSHGHGQNTSTSPNFAAMFSFLDDGNQNHNAGQNTSIAQPIPQHISAQSGSGGGGSHPPGSSSLTRRSPISPPLTNPPSTPAQPDLLTRLRQCCHLSDSHVVNDPGLLIFATRLCQSFPCSFGGGHADGGSAVSDSEHLLLDDSWRLLRNQLDPGTDIDGENRINTGRMAAELVIRAAHSRGSGGWITCRYAQGMSVKRTLVAGLIQGLGGSFE